MSDSPVQHTGADYLVQIVDFVIWQLFSRCRSHAERPEHVLCDGYRRDPNPGRLQCPRIDHSIPGVFSLHPNPQVQALKQEPWPQLLKLLGNSGDVIMMDLLLDCAVFTSLSGGRRNYRQLSGKHHSDTGKVSAAYTLS